MNPFIYHKNPTTNKEAQLNVNYWWYEGMLTIEEVEELGEIPANYFSFIREMKRQAQSDLIKLKESDA